MQALAQPTAVDQFKKLVAEAAAFGHRLVPVALTALIVAQVAPEVATIRQFTVGQGREVLGGWRQQQDVLQALAVGAAPRQALVEPAGNHLVGEVRIEHHAIGLVGQVEVIVEQATVAVGAWF